MIKNKMGGLGQGHDGRAAGAQDVAEHGFALQFLSDDTVMGARPQRADNRTFARTPKRARRRLATRRGAD